MRPYEPNDIDRQIVTEAIASGLTLVETGQILGMHVQTLHKYYGDTIERARAEMIQRIGGKLMEKALEGNMPAMLFFLRTRGGWTETVKHVGDPEQPIAVEHKAKTVEALREALASLAEQKRSEG